MKTPKVSNKTRLILKIVLLAGIIAVGYFFVANKQREKIGTLDTSDWVLYENEELGIKFRYPEGYEINEVPEDQFVHFVPIEEDVEHPAFLVTVGGSASFNDSLRSQCSNSESVGRVYDQSLVDRWGYQEKYCLKHNQSSYYIANYLESEPAIAQGLQPWVGPYYSLSTVSVLNSDTKYEVWFRVGGNNSGQYNTDFTNALVRSFLQNM